MITLYVSPTTTEDVGRAVTVPLVPSVPLNTIASEAAIELEILASTYCFVVGCKASVGSAASVTVPVNVPPAFGIAASAFAP